MFAGFLFSYLINFVLKYKSLNREVKKVSWCKTLSDRTLCKIHVEVGSDIVFKMYNDRLYILYFNWLNHCLNLEDPYILKGLHYKLTLMLYKQRI